MHRIVLLALILTSAVTRAEVPDLQDVWGAEGTGAGEWVAPERFVALSPSLGGEPDEVYVVDRPSGRVQRFTDAGALLFTWDAATTELVDPVAIAAAPSLGLPSADRIFVLDAGADAVLEFARAGAFVQSWPVSAFDDGDVAFDPWEERLGVALSDRHVVEIYDGPGVLRERFGTLGVSGTAPGAFDTPRSLASMLDGRTWVVADTGNDRLALVADGVGVTDTFGSLGSGPLQLDAPHGVVSDCRDRVLVADRGNQRVQRIDTAYDFGAGGLAFGTEVETWFAGEGLDVVDVGVDVVEGVIVGLPDGGDASERSFLAGDFYVLTDSPSRVRRYDGPCCAYFLDPSLIEVTTAGGDLRVTPAGTGPTLAEVGATVELVLRGPCEDDVIAGYPFQDAILDDDLTNELNVCPGGSTADGNSDGQGRMTFSRALAAGGSTQTLRVFLAGQPIAQALPIRVVSPDVNADRVVNVSDVGTFAGDFSAAATTGTVAFRSDLNFDGVINISDIGIMAQHIGEVCP